MQEVRLHPHGVGKNSTTRKKCENCNRSVLDPATQKIGETLKSAFIEVVKLHKFEETLNRFMAKVKQMVSLVENRSSAKKISYLSGMGKSKHRECFLKDLTIYISESKKNYNAHIDSFKKGLYKGISGSTLGSDQPLGKAINTTSKIVEALSDLLQIELTIRGFIRGYCTNGPAGRWKAPDTRPVIPLTVPFGHSLEELGASQDVAQFKMDMATVRNDSDKYRRKFLNYDSLGERIVQCQPTDRSGHLLWSVLLCFLNSCTVQIGGAAGMIGADTAFIKMLFTYVNSPLVENSLAASAFRLARGHLDHFYAHIGTFLDTMLPQAEILTPQKFAEHFMALNRFLHSWVKGCAAILPGTYNLNPGYYDLIHVRADIPFCGPSSFLSRWTGGKKN